MPAGGKRLRCDSSVRAESSPSTLAVLGPSLRDRNELPSPDTASPAGIQISYALTSGIRHVRGSTREIALLKARIGGKLTVHIPDGRTGGDDKASSILSSHIDYDQAEDCFTVTSTMNTAYRTHRNRMFQHYSVFNSKEEALEHPYPDMNKEEWTRVCDLFVSEEFQRRSAINKENRAKLKIVHTSRARSFQLTKVLLKNSEFDEISAVLLYKKTHTNKDGMWTSEDAQENFEKMEVLQLQYELEGKSYTKWRSSLRYGADDARASTDDGGVATEERERADVDDGKIATKKRQRAPEDDGRAAKDPSGTTRMEDATNGGADA
ncbi:hypothetical protein CJ030_MR3G015755 [Morella rubra]|uniref:Uncharacterized protein n=1 Tax=Morella rubra TaxID=262757 RepID=A0A6A1W5H6_9ROSI|nr:hypothetical protein CJ030_MR3G015755 [Morella rubra]